MKICLDPGHGGKSSGAVGDKSYEKDISLRISLKLEKVLKNMGMSVIMTRSNDSYVSLQGRCDIANRNKCDFFLSIHCNSFADRDVSGTETYYFKGSNDGYKFASAVQNASVNYTKSRSRGVKTADFYVLRETDMPAILLEVDFISNREKDNMLSSNDWQDGFAKHLGAAIGKHFGMTPPSEDDTSVIMYRVFHDDVQKGAFNERDNAVKLLDNILKGIDSGSVKITVNHE